MKIEQEVEKFQPVTITLESQAELDVFMAALNASIAELEDSWKGLDVRGEIDTKLGRDLFSQMYAFYTQETVQ